MRAARIIRDLLGITLAVALIVFVLAVLPENVERRQMDERHHRELVEAVEQMTAICEVRHE